MKNFTGSADKPETWICINDGGMYIRTAEIKSKKPDTKPVRILDFTDVHLNYTNDKDKDNAEVMLTKTCRHWNENAASVKALTKAMDYAEKFDKTIITGDVLDYMSYGAMELMDKYIWEKDPNITVTIGMHDYVRQMETGKGDETPVESRLGILQNYWRHDIYYTSEVLGDKVMLINMDNSRSMYQDFQAEKLRADIEKAKKEDLVILIFQHEAVSTGNPQDAHARALIECDGAEFDFYNMMGKAEYTKNDATAEVYKLITENADVVKGLFCGHYHSGYYTEIKASYTDENGTHDAVIPQYVEEGLVYNDYAGHVMEITVK